MIKNNSFKLPNLILLGPPGAGKGSLASKLASLYGYYQLSTGDMFRSEIRNKSPLGLKIKSILDSGAYVSDDITNELVEKTLLELQKQNKPFILDGYPRTLDQADFLKSLEAKNINIDQVILLEITPEQIISRLEKRRICPNCKTIYHMQYNPPKDYIHCNNESCQNVEVIKRADDNPEIIKNRIKIYEQQTSMLINYYEKANILIKLNSYRSIDEIVKDTSKELGI